MRKGAVIKMAEKKFANVGGQAVMEGIMMKSPLKSVMAVRKENGEIVTEKVKFTSLREKYKFFSLPIVRGVAAFVESMIVGYKCISRSADIAGLEDEEDLSEGKKTLILAGAMLVGVALALGLFSVLPALAAWGLEKLFHTDLGFWEALIMGIIRIFIALCYILLVSLMKDIRRLFEYHGAEHKTIFCFENREELTVENVKKQSRLHPRCGTSFLLIVLVISILFYSVISAIPFFASMNKILFLIIRILLIPVVAGFSFEILRLAGRYDNIFTRIISAPGMAFQKITTREPDDGQIEVAISALKQSLINDETGEIDTEAAYKR